MRISNILVGFIIVLSFSAVAELNEIKNFKQVNESILTGGQPDKPQIETLAKEGVTTVINFRGEGEFSEFDEQAVVEEKGMQYLHLPIDSRDAFTKENVRKFHNMLEDAEGKTFLHCGSGNRVGAMFALDAYWNQGKSAEEALNIGTEAGLTSLRDHVSALMDSSE